MFKNVESKITVTNKYINWIKLNQSTFQTLYKMALITLQLFLKVVVFQSTTFFISGSNTDRRGQKEFIHYFCQCLIKNKDCE